MNKVFFLILNFDLYFKTHLAMERVIIPVQKNKCKKVVDFKK